MADELVSGFEASLIGIDISSDDAGTAACVLGLRDGRLWVNIEEALDDAKADALIRAGDITAIDAPFGWPTAFATFAGGWMPPENLEQRLLPDWAKLGDAQAEWWRLAEALKFRATDRYVRLYRRDHKERLQPGSRWASGFSVSADRLALPAMRTMRILERAGVRDITGAGEKVIEVYPGLALAEWHSNDEGYKDRTSPKAKARRARIVGDFVKVLRDRSVVPLADGSEAESAIAKFCALAEASADVLDAFICALNAWAYQAHMTVQPTDGDVATFWDADLVLSKKGKSFTEKVLRDLANDERGQAEVISSEGWIHHPNAALERIVGDRPWHR